MGLCGKQAGTDRGQVALRRLLFSARSCLRQPKSSASLGQSTAWAALAGHTSLFVHIGVGARLRRVHSPDLRGPDSRGGRERAGNEPLYGQVAVAAQTRLLALPFAA